MGAIFLQTVSFLALLGLLAAWASWVWEDHRPIDAPLGLGDVVVHGAPGDTGDALAKAIAVGVVGAIAEHYRTAAYIRDAAKEQDDDVLIGAIDPAPRPLLAETAGAGVETLDLTLEFAGAKIQSSGVARLFQRTGRRRGALAVAVSVTAESGNERAAVISASFPENSRYGFELAASGTADALAHAIGMRFVQAHYARGDLFWEAFDPEDFRTLWKARRDAASLALRRRGGEQDAQAVREEAERIYRTLGHVFQRYTRRQDLQKLAAWLSAASGRLERALAHAEAARASAGGAADRLWLAGYVSSLEVEVRNAESARQAPPAAVASTGAQAGPEAALHRLALDNAGRIAPLGLEAVRGAPRRPRIGLVLGRPTEEWMRFATFVGDPAQADPSLEEYSTSVLSLILSLAPEAELVLSPVAETSAAGLAAAARPLADSRVDVIYAPFGGSQADDLLRPLLAALSSFDGLLILPAGNAGAEVPASVGGGPARLLVGALTDEGLRQPYSNHGPGVGLYAPGEMTVVAGRRNVAVQQGTAFSGAVVAAGAALTAAAAAADRAGPLLRDALVGGARPLAGGAAPAPDFAAAAAALAAAVASR